ncbi:MAG: hypothetical protein LPK80_10630 [Bacteroidota bacterium]|nr:hypothetical protein [Bacteroidota bacterium]
MKRPISIEDRILTAFVKGISFGGVMSIIEFLREGHWEFRDLLIYTLAGAILFGFLGPVRGISKKNPFGFRKNFGILVVVVILGQILALVWYLTQGRAFFLLFLLGSLLIAVGAVQSSDEDN